MKSVYESVLSLMGKSNEDPSFADFLQNVGEPPEIYLKSKASTEYMFCKTGFGLSFMEKPACFASAFFILDSSSKPTYRGELPADVAPNDTRDTVNRKLSQSNKDLEFLRTVEADQTAWDYFRMREFELGFCFRLQTSGLCLMAVRYLPARESGISPKT